MSIRATSIAEAFSEVAARIGDAEAILSPGRRPLLFSELPRQLLRIRDALASFGVGRQDRVVAVLPRGPECAVLYLGVASCAAYAPLNPSSTEQEFEEYLERMAPRAVVVAAGQDTPVRRAARKRGIRLVDLVPDERGPAGTFELLADAAEGRGTQPGWSSGEDIALILCTSGTTSRPKLVPLRQRHLLAYCRELAAHLRLGPADRCLHMMPHYHGHGLKASLLVPLTAGCSVVIGASVDVATFFAALDAFRPTWYSAAYTIHRAILDAVESHRDVIGRTRLRFIRSGSGRLEPEVMAGIEQLFGAPMIEGLSMSEVGTLTCNPLPPAIRKPGTVGIPMFNEVRIMDERGRLLDGEQEGEVVVRGPSVFDGYLDDPARTAASFVNGWFRSGDLGRFDADGYLTITGRAKELIIRGGFKVSPNEVDEALRSHPDVADAATFGVPHPTLGEDVAAAVVWNSAAGSTQALREFVLAQITASKTPSHIMTVSSIPRTATGKIKRYALATQFCDSAYAPYAAPESEMERFVSELFAGVLGTPAVGRFGHFFGLGGDSLKAGIAIARANAALGLSLTGVALFARPTVAEFARSLSDAVDAESGDSPPPITRRNRPAPTRRPTR